MAKQAHLILEEAGSKQLEESKGVVEKALAQHFPDMIFKSFAYEADHPEEVTYHLGQLVKFMSRPNGAPEPQEQLSEEELTFRQQVGKFWQGAKPMLKQLAEEVWYSKDDLAKRRAGLPTTGRIATQSVRIHDKQKESPA